MDNNFADSRDVEWALMSLQPSAFLSLDSENAYGLPVFRGRYVQHGTPLVGIMVGQDCMDQPLVL